MTKLVRKEFNHFGMKLCPCTKATVEVDNDLVCNSMNVPNQTLCDSGSKSGDGCVAHISIPFSLNNCAEECTRCPKKTIYFARKVGLMVDDMIASVKEEHSHPEDKKMWHKNLSKCIANMKVLFHAQNRTCLGLCHLKTFLLGSPNKCQADML